MTDFEARDGVAVVAGGSGGLGRAVARLLAERGSRVAFTYHRNVTAAASLSAELTGATAHRLDLTDPSACADLAATVAAELGGVHTLVYAAGPHVPMVHLSRVSPTQLKEQLDTDVAGFFNLVHPMLPLLRASAGSLVAITTAATRRYPVRDGLSAGPKGAVEALVRGIAAEEGRFGVRANCVGPGMLTDGMAERLIGSGELDERSLGVARGNIPMRRFGTAADIAELVAFLASDRAGFISGQCIDVDGGYTA